MRDRALPVSAGTMPGVASRTPRTRDSAPWEGPAYQPLPPPDEAALGLVHLLIPEDECGLPNTCVFSTSM